MIEIKQNLYIESKQYINKQTNDTAKIYKYLKNSISYSQSTNFEIFL